jgi:hypothetical protein
MNNRDRALEGMNRLHIQIRDEEKAAAIRLACSSVRSRSSSDSSRSSSLSFSWFRRASNHVDCGDGLADGELHVDEALFMMTLYGPAGKMGLEDLSMRSQHVGSAILAEKIESENMPAGAAEGVPTGGTTEDSALMSFSPTTPSRPAWSRPFPSDTGGTAAAGRFLTHWTRSARNKARPSVAGAAFKRRPFDSTLPSGRVY